jgi:hypothetical protein
MKIPQSCIASFRMTVSVLTSSRTRPRALLHLGLDVLLERVRLAGAKRGL